MKLDRILKKLGKYKYLLLVLFVGLVLILFPSRSGGSALSSARSDSASDEEARLEEVLGRIDGAGEVSVLCSENGVAVVCGGAESASVRLAVTQAVTRYTGLGSDRITVLKMKQEAGN
jgi:hypothetical protein